MNRRPLPPSERYILQVDLENAFNNADRAHFLSETRHRFPTLSSWAKVSYGTPSHLFFRGHQLCSSVGTRQGDPLGSLLFGAGLHSLIETIDRDVPELVANQWIMDDGTLIGSLAELSSAIDIISNNGPSKGFFLNASKSSLWVGEDFSTSEDPSRRGIPKADPWGFELLGSPIGSDSFISEVVNARISKLEDSIVSKLSTIKSPQI